MTTLASALRTLQDWRANAPLMRRVAGTLFVVAAVMLSVTLLRVTVTVLQLSVREAAAEQQARAASSEELAAHYASIVAACMRGEIILWIDPHTGADVAAFCDVEVLGRIGR